MKRFLFLLLGLMATSLFASGFLMPDQAFKPSAVLNDKGQIVVDVKLGDGIYLYEKEFKISLKDSKNLAIDKVQLPQSVNHEGDKVYLTSPHVIVNLKKNADVSGVQKIDFVLAYQGCSTKGLCYEPQNHAYSFNVDVAKLGGNSADTNVATTKKAGESETQSIADTLKSGNLVLILGMFFIFGLLLSLTPCVFPMIPIISSVIVSQGEGLTTKRAFFLSIVYVLSMSVAYTFAGILAGLFGSNLQAALQTPWVIYTFAGIFVALSLSMFTA